MFYTLLVIISLPLVITVLYRSTLTQTLSARLLASWASEKMNREISVESVSFSFIDGIYLSGLKAYDHKSQPILILNSLTAMPQFAWSSKIHFKNIEIDGASFTYGRYMGDKQSAFNMFLGSSKSEGNDFLFSSSKLSIINSSFRLFDEHKSYYNDKGMDYANIEISDINAQLKDFRIINDSILTKILVLKATERCGLKIENLTTDFSISSEKLTATNSKLTTERSRLDFDLEFIYSDYSDMTMFNDSVEIVGEIRPSDFDLADLGYFSDVMFKMPDKLKVSGSVQGKVNELNGDDIILEYADNTSFMGDVYIKGLPDFYNSYIILGIHDFRTSKCDLQSFVLPIEEKTLSVPLNLKCTEDITVSGNFMGYYGNFKSNLDIRLQQGQLLAEIFFNANKNDSIHLATTLVGNELNIGKILQIDEITAPMSFNADIEIKGESKNDLVYGFKTVISSVGIMDYNVKRIKFDGNFSNDNLKSNFRVGDKNLMADGNFMLNLNEEQSFEIDAAISSVNIEGLGFWNDAKFVMSTDVNFRTRGFDFNYINAELKLNNSDIVIEDDVYHFDTINIIKEYEKNSGHSLTLKSDVIDANLNGDFLLTELLNNSIGLVDYYYPFSGLVIKDTISKNANLVVEIKDSRILYDHFVKGLEIEHGSKANLNFDFANKLLDIDFESKRLNYFGIGFIDNIIVANTEGGTIQFDYEVESIVFKDSTSANNNVLGLEKFHMLSKIGDSIVDFDISWFNKDTVLLNKGRIKSNLKYSPKAKTLRVNMLDVFVNNVAWNINPSNRIYFDSLGVEFSNLNISAANSNLFLNGRIPYREFDTLEVVFNKWDLSHFDIITIPYNIDLDGIINGELSLGMIGQNPTLISDIGIKGLQLNANYMGDAQFHNSWDNINKSIYLKGQIVDDSSEDKSKILYVEGNYYPFNKTESLDVDFKFNSFKLPSIEAFLDSYVSEIKGKASGEISLRGTVKKPYIQGYASINNTSLIIKYLNTRYSFSDVIVFEKDKLKFDKLIIYDTLGNKANISGFMKHENLSNLSFDVNISSEKLLFFNTTRKMNELYYGKGILSGNINIKGPPNDIKLDINTSTKEGTKVYLPLDYTSELSDKDYIIFIKNDIDSIADVENEKLELAKKKKKDDELKYDINLAMGITPIAKINIFMPSNMGKIEAQGTGDLNLDVNSEGEFKLLGEYVVERGIFHFTIENMVNKRFELVKGGRISWTGDPYAANVKIKGLYKVKANLSSLGVVIDSTAAYKNKVNVECYIILSNKLMDPTIRFEIKMPELDPDLQRIVYAELDTTNQAMVNQQMISLLVLGSFSFSNASSIDLSASYYTILTNQLSSMLSRISDDFDIGVNYKPGDNITNEEFEVALSTQLFDDRLLIDGNFGLTYDRSQQNASNIVGDVDIAYKLTPDGRWILKVFNHSNVNSWYYYNSYDKISPYTQGIGIAYRKEFNNLKEFFTRAPKREKKSKNENKD